MAKSKSSSEEKDNKADKKRTEAKHKSGETIVLGESGESPQFGILGSLGDAKVALDLNQTHTISLFGVQGSGKSYTLGSILEMAVTDMGTVNELQAPLGAIVFHYSQTQDYEPEYASMISPNDDEDEVKLLKEVYGAQPKGLSDILILVPKGKLEERRREFPNIRVESLLFSAKELQASHWKFLMGAVESDSMYMKQISLLMRSLRENLTLEGLREGVENDETMTAQAKKLARTRLEFAGQYIDPNADISAHIRPGRVVIVDARDEFLDKDEALGLFVVLLQLFSEVKVNNQSFNKLVVFDEAHKYMDNPELVQGLVEVVREMRHRGTSIVIASQDPPSVPTNVVELSSQIMMHRFNSPAWIKHVKSANVAIGDITPEDMGELEPGEAYVWSSKASHPDFSKGAVKISCRPRITKHGGETKTAIEAVADQQQTAG